MKRLAIFAHYDKQNVIDPYVISYLKELKKYIDDIIFVSDGDLSSIEVNKVKGICLEVVAKKHSQYDFGSYKVGFQVMSNKYPQKLQEIDELLFVNDSCYLVGNFEEIFDNMSKKDNCDCWGLTDALYNHGDLNGYHVQSYFLSFRKSIFLSQYFQNFINNIGKLENYTEIVYKYEIGLSQEILKRGHEVFVYFGAKKVSHYMVDNEIEIMDEIYEIVTKNSFLSRKYIENNIINNVSNIHVLNFVITNKFYIFLKMGLPLLKRKIIQKDTSSNEILLYFWRNFPIYQRQECIFEIENYTSRFNDIIKSIAIYNNRFLYFISKIKSVIISIFKFSVNSVFYIKKYYKNGQKIATYKILFFKVKKIVKEKI